MATEFVRLDFAPGWATTNENLIELAGLFDGQRLHWTPSEGEWSAREIFAHLVMARYHGPIASADDMARLREVAGSCETLDGIQRELRSSWEMLARFLSDQTMLEALYDSGERRGSRLPAPPLLGSVERAAAGLDLGYVDHPDRYTGHYIAYHRFAHDLHHRSTLVGYLSQLGVTLDGHRIRPL
jgi:hypothetical protein